MDNLKKLSSKLFRYFLYLTITLSAGTMVWAVWRAITLSGENPKSAFSTLAILRIIAVCHFFLATGFMVHFVLVHDNYCESQNFKESHNLVEEDKNKRVNTFAAAFRLAPRKETLFILFLVFPLLLSAIYASVLAVIAMPELKKSHEFLSQHWTDEGESVTSEQVSSDPRITTDIDLIVDVVALSFVLLSEVVAICRLFHLRYRRGCRLSDPKTVADPPGIRMEQTRPSPATEASFHEVDL